MDRKGVIWGSAEECEGFDRQGVPRRLTQSGSGSRGHAGEVGLPRGRFFPCSRFGRRRPGIRAEGRPGPSTLSAIL